MRTNVQSRGRRTDVGSPKPKPKSKSRRKASADADSPRIARRERRREQSREEIVDAARRVLLRNGIANTTLDAVAEEVGLTKAALFFEVMYSTLEMQASVIEGEVANLDRGGDALRAIIAGTVHTFAKRLDDFRLTFLHAQVAKPGTVRVTPQQLARIRPLNDRAFGGAARLLDRDWKRAKGRAGVDPRMMSFLAHAAALGVLTMKGLVEASDDPLLYSDEQLVDALSRIFEAAAAP